MNKFTKRFEELELQAVSLDASKKPTIGPLTGARLSIDGDDFLEWTIKVRSLIRNACGVDSEHYKAFTIVENSGGLSTHLERFRRFRAVFRAAREDYAGGYLTSIKTLVQAELFDSELEQASELLSSGYKLAAAVIAGVVLETGLRELCDRHAIQHSKLDKMNADLTKQGVFSKLYQKRITALADIRNSAAHGKPDEFQPSDVESMIRDVGDILARHLD